MMMEEEGEREEREKNGYNKLWRWEKLYLHFEKLVTRLFKYTNQNVTWV